MFRPEEITVGAKIGAPAPGPADFSDNPYAKEKKAKKKKNKLEVGKQDHSRSQSVRKAAVANRLTVQPDFANKADKVISKQINVKEQKKIQASLIKKIGELEVDADLLEAAQSVKLN